MTTACQVSLATDMENLEISLFEREDIPSLAEIEREEFSTPFKEKDFEIIYESDISNVLVAKQNGKVAGYVSFTVIIDECQIINFATKNEFNRKGVGKAVMTALLEHSRKIGVCKYFLEVRVSNIAAIELYKKFGFVPVGISKNHFSLPREDAVLMNLEL